MIGSAWLRHSPNSHWADPHKSPVKPSAGVENLRGMRARAQKTCPVSAFRVLVAARQRLMRTLPKPFVWLQKIGGATDAHGATVQNMGIDHGGFDILVS